MANEALNRLAGAAGISKPLDPPSTNRAPLADYTIKGREANWFKSLPYGFKASIRGTPKIFYLPINPSNLNITTHYATNMITTLYDTIEEHSEVRYFDISISGTTGFSPQYNGNTTVIEGDISSDTSGRAAYQSGEVFSNLAGGFFKQTLGKLDAALNSAKDTLNAIKGTNNKFQPGVSNNESGYVAFHNLYKFFLDYKASLTSASKGGTTDIKDVVKGFGDLKVLGAAVGNVLGDKTSSSTPLLFLNYKDNNQYSVVIQNFVLERSAENPMLYNYRITMRGYNLQPIGESASGSGYLEGRLAALGLGKDKPSIASRFKNGVKSGRATLNNLKGALGSLGR